jgi:hypothetical protein
MTRPAALSDWTTEVSTQLPHLTRPYATVLALWSFGIACTRTCGRGTVATFLGLLLGQKVANIEQRLYEWCLDAPDKAGRTRTALDVTACFVPLLAWVLRVWQGTELALALDATSLGARFVVLAVSVVYRGNAIPVAWTVLPAGKKRAWRREWLRMLRMRRPAIPRDWTVLVLADRGLYARWLFRRIVRVGWHPFLRINRGGTFRPANQAAFVPLARLVDRVGTRWRGCGTAFVTRDCRLDCTLVAWWGAGHTEPWFVLTDLPPDGCDAQWYALRGWCEHGFRSGKRGGWQWQVTQMGDPARAARLWLALAVATLWMVTIGTDMELGPSDDHPELPNLQAILGVRAAHTPRRFRLFRLGGLWLLVQLIRGQPIPCPRRLVPEPWPTVTPMTSGSTAPPKALAYAVM